MKKNKYVIVATCLIAPILAHLLLSKMYQKNIPMSQVIAYYTEWSVYDRSFYIEDVNAKKITRLLYAFIKLEDNGQISIWDEYAALKKPMPSGGLGSFSSLEKLHQKSPDLGIGISIGGWTGSQNFHQLKNKALRDIFVSSLRDFMIKYPFFDCVDIDWEYPGLPGIGNKHGPEDSDTLSLIANDVRYMLNQLSTLNSRAYYLTLTIGGSVEALKYINFKLLSQVIDSFNIMAYDFHGAWDMKTGHYSPLYQYKSNINCIDSAVNIMFKNAVPPHKIVIGVPFYGRSWSGLSGSNNPISSFAKEPGPGTWEIGVLDYKDIKKNFLSDSKFKTYYDKSSGSEYLFDGDTLISYDSPETIKNKIKYAYDKKIAGIMVWELSADNGDLINCIDNNISSIPRCYIPRPLIFIVIGVLLLLILFFIRRY